MFKTFASLGSITAFLAVALGAFGAHALKARLTPEMLAIFETGVQYHFYHALGLLAVAFISTKLPQSTMLHWSGWLMFAGIVIFSGSLYILSISGVKWLGAITPIGGVCFLASWALLAIAVIKG